MTEEEETEVSKSAQLKALPMPSQEAVFPARNYLSWPVRRLLPAEIVHHCWPIVMAEDDDSKKHSGT